MSFIKAAQQTLEELFEQLDEQYGDIADVEEDGESLSLETDDGRVWLLNIQKHHEELWLSSPLTGGHHYCLKNGAWVNTKDSNSELHSLLLDELKQIKK